MAETEKVSVSIGKDELRDARRMASRLGLSLSTFVTAAVRRQIEEQARREAAAKVLETFAPEERASPREMDELVALWSGSAASKKSRGRRKRR